MRLGTSFVSERQRDGCTEREGSMAFSSKQRKDRLHPSSVGLGGVVAPSDGFVLPSGLCRDVGEVLAGDGKRLPIQEGQVDPHLMLAQEGPDGIHRHGERLLLGIAVDPG